MSRVLIIAAHPDDDILGVGGFIAKYPKYKFKVLFLAEGSSCRFEDISIFKVKKAIEHRNSCAEKSLKKLGVKNIKFNNFDCGRLNIIPMVKINKVIEKEIINYRPSIVFTHAMSDTNFDHRIVFNSTLISTRPQKKFTVKKVFSYEVLSSTNWGYNSDFNPNYFEKLDYKHLKKKWLSLKEYNTETQKFPLPRSFDGLKSLAMYRGMQANFKYAEAYQLLREFSE